MKRSMFTFLMIILLALPSGSLGVAQENTPLVPERLPSWENNAYNPEERAWRHPEIAGRAETAAPPSLNWHIERVDDPHNFSAMGQRSLALDAAGHPHIAYGEDHLYYAWHDGVSWQIETVDPSGGVGSATSLALDTNDHPHISYCGDYYDGACGDLKYAHFDGTSWISETVDSGGVGYDTSLALDANDCPHISYCDSECDPSGGCPCFALKYAHFDGASWQIETVDSAPFVGGATSLALDADDHPHISYQGDGLKYAHFDGTSWQIETVDSEGGGYTSLALDANDQPHISYLDWTNYDLKYAGFDGTSWISETIDSAGSVGFFTSLALDANDQPHISYLDYTNSDLKYAGFDGTSWLTETVDSAGDVGRWTSLALDANDHPQISYCLYNPSAWTCNDLKYVHFDGTSWISETVDSAGGEVGRFNSLALDAGDQPHISYYDYTNSDLKYAHFAGTSWQIETVDSAGYVGWSTSLALDANDHPHISYHGDGLKYAHFDGTSWLTETVDSAGGSYTSLALDAGEHPHISYVDWTNHDLKYAHFDGTSWLTETVDGAGSVGWTTSLALDANDHPHISYCLFHSGFCFALTYAHFDGTSWLTETVDSTGGDHTSLALDAGDHPHIGYYGGYPSYNLKYARFDGSAWQIETVDSAFVGRYTSLALDANDHPHISYLDDINYDLKYVHFDGTSWISETVDSAAYVGSYTSLALDASDHPHISYYDGASAALKYAWEEEYVPVSLDDVTIDGPATGAVMASQTFTATVSPISATKPITYAWQADGQTPVIHTGGGITDSVDYTWELHGSYAITVTASNMFGSVTDTHTIAVNVPITGLLAVNNSPTLLGDPTIFTATITAGTNVSYTWDFGDDVYGAGENVTHTYALPGTYTATVTSTNSVSMDTATTTVQVGETPVVGFTSNSPVFLGETAVFTNTTTGTEPIAYLWDFGDTITSTLANPTHIYAETGSYTVTLTAMNAFGSSQVTEVFVVEAGVVEVYLPVVMRPDE